MKKKVMKKKRKKIKKTGLFGSLEHDTQIPFPPRAPLIQEVIEPEEAKVKVVGKFRFEKGKVVELSEIGAKIKFSGHSHKRCRPGQKSPLLCSFTIELEGEEPVNERYSLRPDKSKRFKNKNSTKTLNFEIIEYKYGNFMDLRVSVDQSFFDEVKKTREENENFKRRVSVLPYHMILLIFENYELEFHENYENKNMIKLFFGYFERDFTRKIFHIFSSVKYKQWIDRKYMPFHGIKNLNHFYNQTLSPHRKDVYEDMKLMKSIRHFCIDEVEVLQILVGGEVPTLTKLLDVSFRKSVPLDKVVETLNEAKNELEVLDLDVNLNSGNYDSFVTQYQSKVLSLEIPNLRVLKLSRFPLENVFTTKVMKNLQKIRISGWRISTSQLESIFVNRKLRKLGFISCKLEVLDAGYLEKIFNLPDLRHLSFAYSQNLDKTQKIKIDSSNRLEVLEFQESGEGFGAALMECICTKLERLKSVNFTKNRLSKECSDIMLSETCVWKKKETKIILGYRHGHEDDFGLSNLRQNFDVQCW